MKQYLVTSRKLNKTLGFLGTLFTLTACVTVNVNFPESAVQKETDSYVRDLYRSKEKSKTPSAAITPSPSAFIFESILGVSDAIADEAVFKITSNQALAIKDSMQSRVQEVLSQKRQGLITEGADGLLKVSPKASEKPLLKKKTESLVESENRDREALYSEVIRSNGLSENQLPAVRRSFMRSFQSESPSGTWIQDEGGKLSQKP